jgi:hypothetical protein
MSDPANGEPSRLSRSIATLKGSILWLWQASTAFVSALRQALKKRKKSIIQFVIVPRFRKFGEFYTWILDIVLHSLLFAFVFGVLLYYFRQKPERIHSVFLELKKSMDEEGYRDFIALVLAVGLAPVVFVLKNFLQPKLAHVTNRGALFASFPIWVCAILGVLTVCLLDTYYKLFFPNPSDICTWLWVASGSMGLVALYSLATKPKDTSLGKNEMNPTLVTKTVEQLSDQELIDWLESDEPSELDLFGTRLSEKSRQLRDMILNQKRGQKIQSIGIVGKHGTGKSSMIRFLKNELCSEKKYIFCQVSTWRFDESATAIQHILSEMLRVIGNRIDTFRVRKLPDSFRKGFSSFGGELLDKLSDMVFGDESLKDRLEKLDAMLTNSDQTLVLVVEDLDRDNDSKFDSGQVQAFLHLLKRYCSIITIITGDHRKLNANNDNDRFGRGSIDFDKLCDHRLQIYSPDIVMTAGLIKRIKSICVRANPISCEEFLHQDDGDYWDYASFSEKASKNSILIYSVIRVLESSRTMKQVLRRTLNASCGPLAGEVDWDHLFLANVLRQTENNLLHFIDRFHEAIAKRDWQLIASVRKHSLEYKPVDVNNSLRPRDLWVQDLSATWCLSEIEAILAFLVPSFPLEVSVDRIGKKSWPPMKPQGAASFRYWRRILNESLGGSEAKDTDIVLGFREWAKNGSDEFVRKISFVPDYLEGFLLLASNLSPDSLQSRMKLYRDLVHLVCSTPEKGSVSDYSNVLFRISNLMAAHADVKIMRSKTVESDEFYEYFKELLELSASTRLRVLFYVWNAWMGFGFNNSPLIPLLRQVMLDSIKVSMNSVIVASSLMMKSDTDILFDLIGPVYVSENGGNADLISLEWSFLGAQLMNLIKEGDQNVIECVRRFLTRNGRCPVGEYDHILGEVVFGVEYRLLREILDI